MPRPYTTRAMAQLTIDEAVQLALRHYAAGELAQAEGLCRLILEKVPTNAGALQLLGMMALRCGQSQIAVQWMERGVAANPQSAECHRNLGEVYRAAGRLEAALGAFAKAVELDGHDPHARYALGQVHEKLGQIEQAVEQYRQCLNRMPEHDGANLNLGILLDRRGEEGLAIEHIERALKVRPDYPEARMARAAVHLRRGEFEQGWEDYEWRWRTRELAGRRLDGRIPVWDGSELKGRRILVRWEQGMGDTIQFVRYVPLLARQGGRVVLEVQPPLEALLTGMEGVEQLVTGGGAMPACDVQVPLLSLPRLLKTRLDSIPAGVPYVKVETGRVQMWREKVENEPALKVGLVWAGNPEYPNDKNRSTVLGTFAPWGSIDGVRFYSLQKGPAAGQVRPGGLDVVDWTGQLRDFADTAGLIEQMDLVITVDTAVAHLAGAMGKPVWTLLAHVADWRWLADREDTPWYPSMRLFRQERAGDWSGVVERVGKALQRQTLDR